MKRFAKFICFVTGFCFLFIACQKSPFLSLNGPRTFTFTRDGGSESFSFTCNRDWTISSTESWIQITPSTGSANDAEIIVKIVCAQNTTFDHRTAVITIESEDISESITVSQETGIGLIISPNIFELTNAEQMIEIEVQKNVQYSVAIDNDCIEWIEQRGTKALSTDKITFLISANTSYGSREGKIVFKQLDGSLSEYVIIRQDQTNGLFITTPEYSLSNNAHTLNVEIKTNVEYEVSSQADWITYIDSKALDTSTIALSIAANESYDNRTGVVFVKQTNGNLTGKIIIAQNQTDYMSVTPTYFEVSNEAQDVAIEVKDNVKYDIVISEEYRGWISLLSDTQTKTLTDDTVVLSISENLTYDNREAFLTIKQTDGSLAETVHIIQAYGEGLIVNQNIYELERAGGFVEIEVQANVDYDVTTDVDWVHYTHTKALTASSIILEIEENDGVITREANVAIKQKSGDLTSYVTVRQSPFASVEFGGYTYKTIKYGEREWFAENLQAKFGQNEGNTFDANGWPEKHFDQYFWAEQQYGLTYNIEGFLNYSFFNYANGTTLCPEGWHVPTSNDWSSLFNMSYESSSEVFLKDAYGGSDDYSFGGNYGEYISASYWIDFGLFQAIYEWAEISETSASVVCKSWGTTDPLSAFRYVRCVKGPIVPEVQSLPAQHLTTNSAVFRCEILNDQQSSMGKYFRMLNKEYNKVIRAGFRYGTNKDNLCETVYTNNAELEVEVKQLDAGTVYYYQPFVEYEGGESPSYGNIMSCKTYYGTLNYQGDQYYTTLIGNVEIMSQNLRATALNDGTEIPMLSADSDWSMVEGPAQCYAFNDENLLEDFGRLYNGYAVKTGKICPDGWRVPEFSDIINEYSGSQGTDMIMTGSLFMTHDEYWYGPNFCNNDLALSLLPSGCRYAYGDYCEKGCNFYMWGYHDQTNTLNAIYGLFYVGDTGEIRTSTENIAEGNVDRTGCAIRCVRDK